MRAEEIAAVFDDLARVGAMRITIRPNPRAADLWAAAAPRNVLAVPRVAHVLDLSGGYGEVWSKRFKKRTRSRIRKAEAAGLEVECDKTGKLIPEFYDLLLQSFDRWASQQNEPRFLTHLMAMAQYSLAERAGKRRESRSFRRRQK